ncbi:MAG TPA: SBBP repeat-containing protein [Ignavibacteria bacterium]|nr:SBBP repeat-containing protein [Ignavibacteria bacterium]
MKKIILYMSLFLLGSSSFLLHSVNASFAEENSSTLQSGKILSESSDYLPCNPGYNSWIRQLRYGTRTDDGSKVKTDSCGNVYVAGNSDSSYSSIGNSDFLIIKYGPSGDTLWIRKYNGIDTTNSRNDMVSDLVIDVSGNVFVTGKSMNKYGNFDYATVKYNTDGVFQWARRFNAPYNDADIPSAIAVDNSGNVYVTGQSRYSSFDNQYVTIKYNSNGDSLWLANYNGGGNSSSAFGLCVDNSGNCYVSGHSLRFAESWNFVTIKYNSSGIAQWTKMYNGAGGNTQEVLNSMKMDTSGNIYLNGYSNMSSPNMDYIAVKYDKNGNFLWASTYNGTGNGDDFSLSSTYDLSGNVYVTGYSTGTGSNNFDIATVKYNSSGVQQWVQRFNGPGNYIDIGRDVKTDLSGNIFVAGSAYLGNYSDAIVIKYSPAGVQTGIRIFNGTANRDDYYISLTLDKLGNILAAGGTKYNNFDYFLLASKYPQNEFGSTLKLNAVIEGFHYSSFTPFMREDTVKVYLRLSSFPYSIIDSFKQKLSNTGYGEFFFTNAIGGVNYYLTIKHRNSIETWSKDGNWIVFNQDTSSYNFITSASKAYGDNQKLVNSSPVRYAIISGDINQDGVLDAFDLSGIENDAGSSNSGYVLTDLTGDDFVDAADLSIIENNVTLGVFAVTP